MRRLLGAGTAAALAAVLSIAAVLTAEQPTLPLRAGAAIRLRAGTFTPARGEAPAVPPGLAARAEQAGRVSEFLVQFTGPIVEAWKSELRSLGATVGGYVPDFAFRVRMTPGVAARVTRLPYVAWVGPYHPLYKLGPGLAGAAPRPLVVALDRDADVAAVEAALAAAGVPSVRRGQSVLMVSAGGGALDALAQIDGVESVSAFRPPERHNEYGGGVIMGSATANANGFDGSTQTVGIADTGIGAGTAAGAHAGIAASRIASIFNWPGAPDFCFATIVNDGARDVDTGHGTHVSTAAVGAGNASGVGRGTAPAAHLVFQALENYAAPSLLCSLLYGIPDGYYLVGVPGDLGTLFQQAYSAGARVHSDSWGSDVAGAYTTDAQNTDLFVWGHRDLTVTFSAGNAGVDQDADGLVDLMSIGSPATAKNVIAVGASENDRQSHYDCDTSLAYTACAAQGGQNDVFTYGGAWPDRYPASPLADDPSAGNAEQMAAFSSRGPTADGRIKPDLVAPGTWTLSGYSDPYQQQYDPSPNPQDGLYQYDGWGFPFDQAYKYMGGTSMAAPLVAGGAALVRDFYEKSLAHQASAALVKATLINSAVDLLDENNDGVFDNAFPIPNPHEGWGRVDLAGATRGGRFVDDETIPMATGMSAAYSFDVQDPGLPFKATLAWTDYPSSPSVAVNLVNDLDLVVTAPDGTAYHGNVFSGGWSAAGGSADRVNNVENVYVFAASAGTWTVTVSGYNVPDGPQPFALVVDTASGGGTALPVVRASAPVASAAEAGPANGSFLVTRSGETSSPLTVEYVISGTATAGADYTPLSGTVTIAAGAIDAVVPVEVIDDALAESPETVVLTLSPDAAYALGSPSTAIVTIASDDTPPDLVVSTMTAPSTAAAGATVTVTDTTKNNGSAGAPPSETGYYLSTNTTLDAADVFMGSRGVPALDGGALDKQSAAVTVPPATVSGTYYILARADWSGALAETNETNNVRTSGTVRVGPDLAVSAMKAASTAAAGEPFAVTDTIKNQGAGAAAASVTAFYLSTNGAWDAGDLWLGTRAVPPLAAGATDTATTTLTMPASTTVGSYYVLAKADVNDAVAESLETNNLRSSSIVRVGADLVVSAFVAPAAAGEGESIDVAEATTNSGAGDSPESTTFYFISSDASFGPSDLFIGSRAVGFLDGGASDSATATLTIPTGTSPGIYYLFAKADGLDDVAETNENNNLRRSGSIKVGPDLVVASVVAPSTAGAGAPIAVTDTTRNQGGGPAAPTTTAFFLSTNATLDALDVPLGTRAVPALDAAASDATPVSLDVPSGTPTGTYYILAKADEPDVVVEVSETNNVKASGVVRIGPDLVVSALAGPSTAVRGTVVSFTDTTGNGGAGAAPATTTSYYLSANSTLDASDVLLGARAVGALAAGGADPGAVALTIPAATSAATYYVIAKADDPGDLAETSESNNVRTRTLKVTP